ncbi:tetratricopeptide repeat protein 39B-like isoform X1 [Vanessa atalanta]|uniref:tetratricopeptide repeat protein 39B-like isoform X1 n=1 Tax=Vanessa atalanta TaxID=42275 RepID=UPI001FCCF4E9|nr:tetratricopeptide repeat protein 39B-like isoform X1 [Vanessa atalanta]
MALHETPISMQAVLREPAGPGLAPRAEPEEDDFEELDDFEDASDEQSVPPTVDLHTALEDCERAMTLFFNNQIDEAIAIMTPWKDTSLYHAHGAAIFEFIPAVLTLEPAQIQSAHAALRHTFTLCARMRRNYTFVQSIGAIIKKPNYGGYSEEEAHAELVHAEALLLLACLGSLEGEEMTGFVRASLRIKTSFNAYRNCAKILEKKTWESEESHTHFESGVRLGLATFNVMIALLPPKVITLLEFVGFTADKEKGKSELITGARSPGLRSVLCELTLLVYFLIIGHFAAIPPDFIMAEQLINNGLRRYPNSLWFIMFKARMQMLSGMIEEAVDTYETASHTTDMWPQLKHLTYWEMIWAFAMMMKWSQAAFYASKLARDSKWSKTIYMYTQAAMNLERGHLVSIEERKHNADLLLNASCYRQRLLGRSLPMEKFVIRRCERWARRGYLVLPGVEMVCLWNMFPSLAAEPHFADRMLKLIEQTSDEVHNVMNSEYGIDSERRYIPAYDFDDVALVRFLQGSLLGAMSLPRLAIRHLEAVLSMKDKIKENTFLLPYATVEIAMSYYALGDPDRAQELLYDARKKYSGYLLESRLHFRIHSKLELIHAGEANTVITGTTASAVALASVNAIATASTSAVASSSAISIATTSRDRGRRDT